MPSACLWQAKCQGVRAVESACFAQLATHTVAVFPITLIQKATVVHAAIGRAATSNWYTFHGQSDVPGLMKEGFKGTPWDVLANYRRWTPNELRPAKSKLRS